jgi:hypothetical protein
MKVAIDAPNDRLFIVTVYRPSVEEWEAEVSITSYADLVPVAAA